MTDDRRSPRLLELRWPACRQLAPQPPTLHVLGSAARCRGGQRRAWFFGEVRGAGRCRRDQPADWLRAVAVVSGSHARPAGWRERPVSRGQGQERVRPTVVRDSTAQCRSWSGAVPRLERGRPWRSVAALQRKHRERPADPRSPRRAAAPCQSSSRESEARAPAARSRPPSGSRTRAACRSSRTRLLPGYFAFRSAGTASSRAL